MSAESDCNKKEGLLVNELFEELNWNVAHPNNDDKFLTCNDLKESYVYKYMFHLQENDFSNYKPNKSKPRPPRKRKKKSSLEVDTVPQVSKKKISSIISSESADSEENQNESIVSNENSKDKKGWVDLDKKVEEESNITENQNPISEIIPEIGFPRLSWLTAEEQRRFLYLFDKFAVREHANIQTTFNQDEYKSYQQYLSTVLEEQTEFQHHVKKIAMDNPKKFNFINPEVKKYVDDLHENKLKMIKLYLPQFFETTKFMIPLVPPQDFNENKFELRLEKKLLELGKVPKIVIPNVETAQYNIVSDMKGYKSSIKNDSMQNMLEDFQKTNCESRISKDKNAEILAKAYHPNIVIASGALQTIIDNFGPNYDKKWELPITVKQYKVETNGKTVYKKVIYVDNNLPISKLSSFEKNYWFYRRTIKVFLTDLLFSYKNPTKVTTKSSSDDNLVMFESSDDIIDLETFGLESETKSMVKKTVKISNVNISLKDDVKNRNKINQLDGQCDSDSDENPLVINVASQELNTDIGSDQKDEVPCDKILDVQSHEVKSQIHMEKDKKGTGFISSSKEIKTESKAESSSDKSTDNSDDEFISKNFSSKKQEAFLKMHQSLSKKLSRKNQEAQDTKLKKNEAKSNDTNQAEIKSSFLDNLLQNQSNFLSSSVNKQAIAAGAENMYKKCDIDNMAYSDYKDPKEFLQPKLGSNITYRLWKLRKKNCVDKELTLLIRCKIHMAHTLSGGGTSFCTVFPKLEYYPQYGGEVCSCSELSRQWISTLLRPDSKLLRARIDVLTGNIFHCEEKTLKQLSAEGLKNGFFPANALGTIYSVLSSLQAHEEGNYILSHDVKIGPFVRLLKSTCVDSDLRKNSPAVKDYHERLNISTSDNAQIIVSPWLQIDTHLITPHHWKNGLVPGMFPPCKEKVPNTGKYKKKWPKKSGRKRKERKKIV